jgi:sulfoxide reductase catalytic subunit YedY
MSEKFTPPGDAITPEADFNATPRPGPPPEAPTRRGWLKWAVGGTLAAAAGGTAYWYFRPGSDAEVLGTGAGEIDSSRYPAKLDTRFQDAGRPMTDQAAAARYCNFYEFTGGKAVWRVIDNFQPYPWKVEVAGMVDDPHTYDIDDLVRSFPLEERVYRHRCVEAWAMVVPWTGFPLWRLLKKAGVKAGAKYVRFVSFHDPKIAPNQRRSLPWPYTEGLTLDEAMSELTFVTTGVYGRPLIKQHGAPVRVVVPWKYGFKGAKSVVKIEVTDRQPATFWNTLQANEYDFWANVNPDVPHPRWSQASERMLGTGERRPTVIYNGYGQWVANLYKA